MAAYPLPEHPLTPMAVINAGTVISVTVSQGESLDWQNHTIAYARKKTGSLAIVHFGDEIAEVLRDLFAMFDRFSIRVELNADAISIGNAVSHIEKEFLHGEGAALRWRLQLTVKPPVRLR
jgi:hypothetical protein